MKIEVIEGDITTQEGWAAFVKERLEHVRTFAQKGELKFVEVSLVITRDLSTGAMLARPQILMLLGIFVGRTDDELESAKDQFAQRVRITALAGRAIASFFVSEAWVVVGVTPEEIDKIGAPRNHPRREEVVIASVAHRVFHMEPHVYTASIKGPKKKRQISDWVDHGFGGQGGRFDRFLVPVEAERDPQHEALTQMARDLIKSYMADGSIESIHPERKEA